MARYKETLIEDVDRIYLLLMQKFYDGKVPDSYEDGPRMFILQADFEGVLVKADDFAGTYATLYKMVIENASDENRDYIVKTLDSALQAAEVRNDWPAALKSVKEGRLLSSKISWSFSNSDLNTLIELHRKNKFRKKIEDLLDDCNFHTLCSLLGMKAYEDALKEVQD